MFALTRLLMILSATAPGGAPPATDTSDAVKAVSAPSEDLTLSFTLAGRIAKLMVAEGAKVRPGQPLAQLDDAVQRKRTSLLEARAADTTAVKVAELRLARTQTVLAKVEKAYADKAAPARELADARMDAAMAELDLQAARFDSAQAKGRHEEARLMLEQMRLLSPSAGRVEQVTARAGESVDALAPVLRIVRIDPLWIDVPVELARARRLTVGRAATARFAGEHVEARGRIIHVASVADAASGTLEVRVQLPNPSARPAGEQVTVRFPTPPPAKSKPSDK
jgi:cobalt-zinc-cadmium efflux system membrane fusion protein